MKENYNIDNEIERTMRSLDGIESAEPNPFFYTRLKARMEKELLTHKKVLGWQFKPIYVYSVLALMFIVNAFTIMTVSKQNQTKNQGEQVYRLYDANH